MILFHFVTTHGFILVYWNHTDMFSQKGEREKEMRSMGVTQSLLLITLNEWEIENTPGSICDSR